MWLKRHVKQSHKANASSSNWNAPNKRDDGAPKMKIRCSTTLRPLLRTRTAGSNSVWPLFEFCGFRARLADMSGISNHLRFVVI